MGASSGFAGGIGGAPPPNGLGRTLAFRKKTTRLFTVLFTACLPDLLAYSFALKQYELEALWCLVIVLLIVKMLESHDPRIMAVLIPAGCLSLLLALPTVPILAAGGVVWLGTNISQNRPLKFPLIAGASWALVALLLYQLNWSRMSQMDFLRSFWTPHFPRLDTGLPRWMLTHLLDFFFQSPMRLALSGMLSLWLFLLGINQSCKNPNGLCLLYLLGIAGLFFFFLSLFQFYPLTDRFLLFGTPFAILLMAWGLESHSLSKIATAIAAILLLFFPLGKALKASVAGLPPQEDIRGALLYLKQQSLPGQSVAVHAGGVPALKWYGNLSPDPEKVGLWRNSVELERQASAGLSWILAISGLGTHQPPKENAVEIQRLLDTKYKVLKKNADKGRYRAEACLIEPLPQHPPVYDPGSQN